MAASPFEIVAGPARIFIAAEGGATFPQIDDFMPTSGWTDLGDTEGGVTVRHTQSVELLYTDQSPGPKKAIRSEVGLEVEFALAELTLETYAKALNDASVTNVPAAGTVAGSKFLKSFRGLDVTRHMLLVRGPSPYLDGNAQFEVPFCIQMEEAELEYTREDKTVLACNFTALEDPLAASEADRFGKYRAQTTA